MTSVGLRKGVKAPVVVNIVYNDGAARAQRGPGVIEFKANSVSGMAAVVNKKVDLSEL